MRKLAGMYLLVLGFVFIILTIFGVRDLYNKINEPQTYDHVIGGFGEFEENTAYVLNGINVETIGFFSCDEFEIGYGEEETARPTLRPNLDDCDRGYALFLLDKKLESVSTGDDNVEFIANANITWLETRSRGTAEDIFRRFALSVFYLAFTAGYWVWILRAFRTK